MIVILNILWFILGGFLVFFGWIIVGIGYCLTIIGIPLGLQAFKIASFSLAPFGKEIHYGQNNALGLIGNIIWIIFGGLELALGHVVLAIIFGITIIGLPIAKQHIKLAIVSLVPFGAYIVKKDYGGF